MNLSDEIKNALENVDETTYRTRMTICKNCPAFTVLKTCADCFCVIPVKAKLKSQSCPRGQWR